MKVDSSGELVQRQGHGKFDWAADAGEGYLRFPNHLWGHGFNNILEESLLTAQLAHLSNRAYVFEDYVWSHSPFPYTLYDFGLRPTRVPLNAFLSGFIAGGNVSTSEKPPHLSVSSAYYNYICPSSVPEEHRIVLSTEDAPEFSDGNARMEWWVNRIKTLGKGKRCVEIRESKTAHGSRLFDFNFFGNRQQLAPLIPSLVESPVLKHFAWSHLVDTAVNRTLGILGLSASQSPTSRGETIPGLLAIHLRRGDYSRHCARLAEWRAGYMGFNLADAMKDQLNIDEELRKEVREATAEARRRRSPRTQQVEESGGLERRWWYWAGRAGQRLTTSADAGTLASTHSAVATGSKMTKPSRYEPPPTPTTDDKIVYGSDGLKDGVRIKKDHDFSRARPLGGLNQEIIALLDDVKDTPAAEAEAPQPNSGKKKTTASGGKEPPQRWMWWGGGSKKQGRKRTRNGAAAEEEDTGPLSDADFDDLELDEDTPGRSDELIPRNKFNTIQSRADKEEAIKRLYFKHCLPTIDQVVQRANEVRTDWANTHQTTGHEHEHRPLKRILLLSNGWPSFLMDLSQALRKDGWDVVDPDESIRRGLGKMKDVDVGVDMALAQKAEVFLGNGFSTLTGNVALFRMGDGDEKEGNRLL